MAPLGGLRMGRRRFPGGGNAGVLPKGNPQDLWGAADLSNEGLFLFMPEPLRGGWLLAGAILLIGFFVLMKVVGWMPVCSASPYSPSRYSAANPSILLFCNLISPAPLTL
jgi:hypothetical protein